MNEHAKVLDEPTAQFFHHNVANLLFLCKRACRDIQTAVAFLCTIEKCPDVDDYKKLTRVMKYLWNMENLPLVLEAENLNTAEWWVNASFAVHPNMHSHTGCLMMLGSGAVYASSTKQKLNTNSSTEAELVGVYDAIPQILWTHKFLAAQGFDNSGSIIHQDNQSAMLLEKHGKSSSSKPTRHIDVHYYYITDCIAEKEVEVKYCPTGEI